jgi:hypothetical protein
MLYIVNNPVILVSDEFTCAVLLTRINNMGVEENNTAEMMMMMMIPAVKKRKKSTPFKIRRPVLRWSSK